MKLKVIVHEAKEGGYWAKVPAIPGCATQGDDMEELLRNLAEAIEGCLQVGASEGVGPTRAFGALRVQSSPISPPFACHPSKG